FYAHTHRCGHTTTVFAAACPASALVQRPCGRGEIWATVKVEAECVLCEAGPPEPVARNKEMGMRVRKGGRR
ncbi:hypothetical protein LTR53_014381, partial [Teratosphaeriaceae sp. CCFEE 6253]